MKLETWWEWLILGVLVVICLLVFKMTLPTWWEWLLLGILVVICFIVVRAGFKAKKKFKKEILEEDKKEVENDRI
jgi:phosphatidylglycerophosphate synthase